MRLQVQPVPETVQNTTAYTAYMECHNQVAGIMYRNICADYRLKVPVSEWKTLNKVFRNEQPRVLSDYFKEIYQRWFLLL